MFDILPTWLSILTELAPDDPCSPNPCQNGGTCTNSSESFTCSCASGFTGDDCGTSTLPGWKKNNCIRPYSSTGATRIDDDDDDDKAKCAPLLQKKALSRSTILNQRMLKFRGTTFGR